MTKAGKTTQARKTAKPVKLSKAGSKIVAGLEEAVAYVKAGNLKGAITYEPVDVSAIRAKTGLSQAKFAEAFGIDKRSLQDWEQGRRSPERTAQLYLRVIEREPEAVKRAIHAG